MYTRSGTDIAEMGKERQTFTPLSLSPAALLLFWLLFLTGCNSPAIYQDQSFNPPIYFGIHTVRSGETLHGIAWRYGRDYQELAAANKIAPPYKIYPGQRINLELPEGFVYRPASPASTAKSSKPTAKSTKPTVSTRKPASTPSKQPIATSGYKNKQSPQPNAKPAPAGAVQWRWPGTGPIIETYSASGRINKGIDLGGSVGDPVYAAASGEVVYAGSGLLGYGQLIIVNHNEQFLSAYAHNHRILVKEGDTVKAGQKIAEIGSTGTNRPKLHFEIRKDGKPVIPMNYLPRR